MMLRLTKNIDELHIGDKIKIALRDMSGNMSWYDATVSKFVKPDIEEADEYGIWYEDVYANVNIYGEEYEYPVKPGMFRFI